MTLPRSVAVRGKARRSSHLRREDHPNAAAFAEVHTLFQPPFVYLYHTLRYLAPRTPEDRKRFPMVENLGVEILATARPFELDMPLFRHAALGPGQHVSDSPPISLRGLSRAAVTVQCTPGPQATRGLRIQVLRSEDGSRWTNAEVLENGDTAVRSVRTTFPLNLNGRFAKIHLENSDPSVSHTDVAVGARLVVSRGD